MGRVDWDEQQRVLMLTGLVPAVPARTMLYLARDWGLPAVAAERASWAKVVDQRILLNGAAGARVIARRVPDGPQLRWLVILDQGLDAADPEIRAGLEAALAELRAATGPDMVRAPNPGLGGRGEIPARAQSKRGAGRRIGVA